MLSSVNVCDRDAAVCRGGAAQEVWLCFVATNEKFLPDLSSLPTAASQGLGPNNNCSNQFYSTRL